MSSKNRQIALGAVALVVLVAAVIVTVARTSGGGGPSDTFTVDGICLACKQPVTAKYHCSERLPAVCPLCGERAVYGTYYCFDCGRRFVPHLVPASDGGPPVMPMIPTCSACGGHNVVGYLPEDPDQRGAEWAPLPEWPPGGRR